MNDRQLQYGAESLTRETKLNRDGEVGDLGSGEGMRMMEQNIQKI